MKDISIKISIEFIRFKFYLANAKMIERRIKRHSSKDALYFRGYGTVSQNQKY